MSFYNLINKVHPSADSVLDMLGIDESDCGRFRDAYITQEGTLAIYIRCGGNNRDDYKDIYERLNIHPNYICDKDDSFDCTYATLFFSIPDAYKDNVQNYIKAVKESGRDDLFLTPSERFNLYINNIKNTL